MNMAEVAGHLTMRIAQLEKGRNGIDASQVIGNLTVRQMNLEQQIIIIFEQIKLMNNQRNAKQIELARLNGTAEPSPVVLEESEREKGLEHLSFYAKSLSESLKSLDELLAAHAAKKSTPDSTAMLENPAAESKLDDASAGNTYPEAQTT